MSKRNTTQAKATELEGDVPSIGPMAKTILGKSYLAPDDLAALLGISRRTLARWDEARIGPPRIKIGQVILYDLDKLNAWLSVHETEPVALDPTVMAGTGGRVARLEK